MKTVGRVGLLAGAAAIASFFFLLGQWAYGFSQFMWLEDELGGSSGAIFDDLSRTPPTMRVLSLAAATALMMALVTFAACLAVALRHRGGGASPSRPRPAPGSDPADAFPSS